MIGLYRFITKLSAPLLSALLWLRLKKGKEDAERVSERKGISNRQRHSGKLIWIHAASVGESQSALVLIDAILTDFKDARILMTSGTKTSADLMAQKLPQKVTHKYYPLDNPKWVNRFLDHWHPNLVLWMESELWPNMLLSIKERGIPAALINARLSPRSFKRWQNLKGAAKDLLDTFEIILAQTQTEADYFKSLGHNNVSATDNLKYSAVPLPFDKADFKALQTDRPIWVYASSHKGEEELAAQTHIALKKDIPDLLTIIAPRHPERASAILESISTHGLTITQRGKDKILPNDKTDIYLADTMGELGLFYSLAPICVVGRCFSDDGGGGHNPIEPALLKCAVLHGPNIQNLQAIYDEMDEAGAACAIKAKEQFADILKHYLQNPSELENLRKAGHDFATSKASVLTRVLTSLQPMFKKAL